MANPPASEDRTLDSARNVLVALFGYGVSVEAVAGYPRAVRAEDMSLEEERSELCAAIMQALRTTGSENPIAYDVCVELLVHLSGGGTRTKLSIH